MNLLQLGDFTLNSGAKSPFKIECDAFTDEDWKTLADLIRQMVGDFSSVEGVPRGGLRLAKELEPYAVSLSNYHLLVDDVLTTGGSMEKAASQVHLIHQKLVKGTVVFARGQCPHWIRAVFQMPECFWIKPMKRST
jgi:orotate phosphoribosyltransferase